MERIRENNVDDTFKLCEDIERCVVEQLMALRDIGGFTTQDVADKLDISVAELEALEIGAEPMTIRMAGRYALAIGWIVGIVVQPYMDAGTGEESDEVH